MTDLAVTKARLRDEALSRRRARTSEQLLEAEQLIAAAGIRLCDGAGTVTSYASFGTEPPTGSLNSALASAGLEVWLPIVAGEDLDWADELQRNLGPEAIRHAAVMLIPALAVSRSGVRLGRGKGHYDRALSRIADRADRPLLVGVIFDDELLDAVPAEPHDVAVDLLLMPSGVVRLGRGSV